MKRKPLKKTTAKAAPAKKSPARATARTAPARIGAATTKKPAKAIDPAAFQAAWQKSMTTNEAHRRLEPLVGTFNARTTFCMSADAPPQTSDGISENRWVLGGRFVEQNYRGSMMNMPFEGIGFTGYDNTQKKYVGIWMDTFGTGIATSIGKGTPSDKVIESLFTCHEPLTGEITLRAVARIQDRDHHTFEMWRKGPDGKEYKNMVCEYSRK